MTSYDETLSSEHLHVALEAARVAARRGHEVTLFEANDHLGGALELWARLPGRGFYRHSIDWWEKELDRLGVTVYRPGVVTVNQYLP